jgi:hypothetical protein
MLEGNGALEYAFVKAIYLRFKGYRRFSPSLLGSFGLSEGLNPPPSSTNTSTKRAENTPIITKNVVILPPIVKNLVNLGENRKESW